MRGIIFRIFIGILLAPVIGYTQPLSGFRAHSHNDYKQAKPFRAAFDAGFESMEADVFLVNGKLLVGHELKETDSTRTLEDLYLKKMASLYGTALFRHLTLLVDVKSEAIPALDSLTSILTKMHNSFQLGSFSPVVISGNRPPTAAYHRYPSFIFFDGRPGMEYTKEELAKVAMISDAYSNYWDRNKNAMDTARMKAAVDRAHKLGKPFRFWGNPDTEQGWKFLMSLGVDHINTDKVDALAKFLKKRPR